MVQKMVGIKLCVALLLSFGTAVVWAQAVCNSADVGKLKCSSCAAFGKCVAAAAAVPTDTKCADTEACVESLGTAFCAPADNSGCNNCGTDPTACDPFDKKAVNLCFAGATPVPIQACGTTEKCDMGACVYDPSSSGTDFTSLCSGVTLPYAYVTDKPKCTTGVLCKGIVVSSTVPCPAGQYFNTALYKCKGLPVNHCDGKSDGLVPHLTDCTKGVVCQGGLVILEIPCATGLNFQGTGCSAATSPICPAMNGCSALPTVTVAPTPAVTTASTGVTTASTGVTTASTGVTTASTGVTTASTGVTTASTGVTTASTGVTTASTGVTTASTGPTTSPVLTTTPKPITCTSSNVNMRYPHATDCKKYYLCRQLSTTTYQYVESTCSGTLVFNAAQSYCDLPTNVVPTCVVTG